MLEWLEVETGISGKGAGLNSKGAAAIPNRGLARHDPSDLVTKVLYIISAPQMRRPHSFEKC